MEKNSRVVSPLVTNLDRYIDRDNNEYIIETRYTTKVLKKQILYYDSFLLV